MLCARCFLSTLLGRVLLSYPSTDEESESEGKSGVSVVDVDRIRRKWYVIQTIAGEIEFSQRWKGGCYELEGSLVPI